MSIVDLPLHDLSSRHPGLTVSIAGCYIEAARICLDRHHTTPVIFSVLNDSDRSETRIAWMPADDQCRRAWANEIDTTEFGAYGCSLAAAEMMRGLVAVHRAETGTGADYYIAPANEPFEDLENCLRLEVSGTAKGTHAVVKHTLNKKVEQTKQGNSNLPALASVVGFEAKIIAIETVQDPS